MSEEKLIKLRMYGDDTPFSGWVRDHEALPSREGNTRLSVQDADLIFHAFMVAVDGLGTREIQPIMIVETKTRDGEPDNAQRDTLWKLHMFAGKQQINGQLLWHFGVFVLSMSGTTPDDSHRMRWGRFGDHGRLSFVEIGAEKLVRLLRFEEGPDTLLPHRFRRHHETHEIARQVTAELGFQMIERITVRS